MAKTDVTVELYYSAAWHDITATDDVYTRDPIRITCGRPDEVQRIPPSAMSLSIRNTSGKYSPRLATSALYGLIGRNTPIRVTVGSSVRFVGEVESWPQRWSTKGNDVWAPITAYGIMRRLNAPGTTAPALSALRRTILSTQPETYWPLEDGVSATQSGSAASQAPPLRTVGAVTFAADAGLAGSLAVPDLSAGALFGTVVGVSATSWHCEFVVKTPFLSGAIARLYVNSATLSLFRIFPPSAAGQPVEIFITDPGGGVTTFLQSGAMAASFENAWHHIAVTAEQNGGNVDLELFVDGASAATTSVAATLGAPTEYWSNHQYASGIAATSFGHVVVGSGTSVSGAPDAMDGYVGEAAADRIDRLCAEEGIAFTCIGDPDETELLGVQRPAKLLDLLHESADADGGILFEPRDSLGLAYRTHSSLYNQTPSLELDYADGGEVAPPLAPVEDTDATANDVTVTRLNGSSAKAVQETGPLNVQEPPDGVGRYRKEVTLVLTADDQCLQQAAWLRHLGTWDEARYPVVNLDLTAMDVAGKTSLIADAAGLDVGDRFTIENPPAWLPPEMIEQHAQGFAETIESHRWSIATNATPALPYEVFELETGSDNRSRIPTGGSTLAGTMTTTSTSRTVNSAGVRWIDSAAYPAHFPFDIMVAGERMTVTAIVGTSSPQTFTMTRSVNGVVKTQASGEAVQLFRAPVIAR